MKFKNGKGVDISSTIARSIKNVLPNFDEPAKELARLGLTEEQIKRVEAGYETGEPNQATTSS